MKIKRVHLLLIIFCAVCVMFFVWFLSCRNTSFFLNSKIDHLGIAKLIHTNKINDTGLVDVFENQAGVSEMDKKLTVFLAGYLNMRQLGLSDDQFFSSINKAEGLNLCEKFFLKNIIKNKYIPIITSGK